ncbi:hypothetical protein EV401DRAFT_2083907 [Pisolithus croceorrhizus]|nr:hypothetical protein EV401DRAFT_2083907 [Pisolithus croceorrhizus]
MSSPRKQTKHRDEGSVDSVVIADLINFLSGLSLNPLTADAVILEIQAQAHPSLFGTPLPSPVTFPVSPHSSHDSPSPQEPATSAHGHPVAQATSTKVHAKPTSILAKPILSVSSSPQSASLAFTTTFGINHISSSGFTHFELVPESLKLLSLVGCPGL